MALHGVSVGMISS